MGAGIANRIGPFLHADGALETKSFEGGRTFKVLIAGAYDAGGLIGSEHNGLVVLDEDHRQIVLDRHLEQSSGYFGPSPDQKAELQRVMAMDWTQFTEFCRSNPRYRNSMPDANMPKPLEIAPIQDRTVFPAADRPDYPFEAPLSGRRDIIEFLSRHAVHRIDGPYSKSTFAWDIKVRSPDTSGKAHGFTPDEAHDERWAAHVEENGELFWDLAGQEAQSWRESFIAFDDEEKGSSPDHKFSQTGRSGGWMILTEWNGHRLGFENLSELEGWLDELKDADLVKLYKSVCQIDFELANPETAVEYAYASHREMLEDEWGPAPGAAAVA